MFISASTAMLFMLTRRLPLMLCRCDRQQLRFRHRLPLGATKAELLFLDGTRKVVDVKSWGSAQLNDIVSYRINSDKEYILTQVASVNATETAGVLVT